MFFSIETELPSGTRLRLQRDGVTWVATFAAFQFVVRNGDVATFAERAVAWVESNVSGASLRIAYRIIHHYAAVIGDVDASAEHYPAPMRETRDALPLDKSGGG